MTCTTVACLPPIRGLDKCRVIGHNPHFSSLCSLSCPNPKVLLKGIWQECSARPRNTLRITRLRLVTRRVYPIHHCFLGVYLSQVDQTGCNVKCEQDHMLKWCILLNIIGGVWIKDTPWGHAKSSTDKFISPLHNNVLFRKSIKIVDLFMVTFYLKMVN